VLGQALAPLKFSSGRDPGVTFIECLPLFPSFEYPSLNHIFHAFTFPFSSCHVCCPPGQVLLPPFTCRPPSQFPLPRRICLLQPTWPGFCGHLLLLWPPQATETTCPRYYVATLNRILAAGVSGSTFPALCRKSNSRPTLLSTTTSLTRRYSLSSLLQSPHEA
jgi:hypothetical protein